MILDQTEVLEPDREKSLLEIMHPIMLSHSEVRLRNGLFTLECIFNRTGNRRTMGCGDRRGLSLRVVAVSESSTPGTQLQGRNEHSYREGMSKA